jgi:hypothetical protein
MPDRFLITPLTSPHGNRRYQVWEYDLGAPRLLASPDPRERYAVKGYVGGYRTIRAAEKAIRDHQRPPRKR